MECQTVTAAEAAKILGVAATTIYAAVKRGELPCVKLGDRVLIPKAALQRMLRQTKQAGPGGAHPSGGRPGRMCA
jgi:excisionase family DNA binding protein